MACSGASHFSPNWMVIAPLAGVYSFGPIPLTGFFDVESGAEGSSFSGNHQDLHLRVGICLPEGRRDLAPHLGVLGIQRLRPVQGQPGYASFVLGVLDGLKIQGNLLSRLFC